MGEEMKKASWIGVLFLLMSCAPTAFQVSMKNARQNLLLLQPGMDKPTVIGVMGAPPRTNEAYTTSSGDFLEAYIYITDVQRKRIDETFHPVTTPLVFVNGSLVGWGWSFYEDSAMKYDIKIKVEQ